MLNKKYQNLKKEKSKFLNSKFFPHIVFDNLINSKVLNKVSKEINNSVSKAQPYYNYNVKKLAINRKKDFGKNTQKIIKYLNSRDFVKKLENLTGIKKLVADPKLEGGGIHIVKKGGFLNIHADFQSHIINSQWSRKINLLLYLNKNWKKNFKGNLELWNQKRTKKISILPKFNRAVIFYTGPTSYHGHPKPLNISNKMMRKSIALYYYVKTNKNLALKETNFVTTKNDNYFKRLPMKIDQSILRVFSFMKRHSLINDRFVTSIIKKISN